MDWQPLKLLIVAIPFKMLKRGLLLWRHRQSIAKWSCSRSTVELLAQTQVTALTTVLATCGIQQLLKRRHSALMEKLGQSSYQQMQLLPSLLLVWTVNCKLQLYRATTIRTSVTAKLPSTICTTVTQREAMWSCSVREDTAMVGITPVILLTDLTLVIINAEVNMQSWHSREEVIEFG